MEEPSSFDTWPFYSDGALSRLERAFNCGDLGSVDGHPSISEFENAFRALFNERPHVAFFNSGTSAFAAGLFALALPRGSEVIVPRQTFRSTVTPLLLFGLVPHFVDCSSDGCISSDGVRRAIMPSTRAIVVTHQWGQPAQVEQLRSLADRHGLHLIEDCSHAHGGRLHGKSLGLFGDFSFFSCGTTKLISGGTGGAFVSASRSLYQQALLFGQPKRRCELELIDESYREIAKSGAGVNLRGSPLSAALATDHVEMLECTIRRKNANLAELESVLLDTFPQLAPVPRTPGWTHGTWYKLPLRYAGKIDDLIAAARELRLDLSRSDCALDMTLAEVARRFRVDLQGLTQEQSRLHSLVLLGTRDLCGERWPRNKYVEAFTELSRRLPQLLRR